MRMCRECGMPPSDIGLPGICSSWHRATHSGEVAELRALIKMRADVNARLRALTGSDDLTQAVKTARQSVSDYDARRRARRVEPGWGEPTVQRDFGWRSIWTTAVVGRQ